MGCEEGRSLICINKSFIRREYLDRQGRKYRSCFVRESSVSKKTYHPPPPSASVKKSNNNKKDIKNAPPGLRLRLRLTNVILLWSDSLLRIKLSKL